MDLPIHLFEKILRESNDNVLLVLYDKARLYNVKYRIERIKTTADDMSIIELKYLIDKEVVSRIKLCTKYSHRLDILKFIKEYIPEDFRYNTVLYEACKHNRMNTVQWLLKEDTMIKDPVYFVTFFEKNLSVFKLLIKKQPMSNVMAKNVSELAAEGSLEDILFLEKYGVPLSENVLDHAIECNKMDTIQYLLNKGTKCTEDTMYAAACLNDNLEIVKQVYTTSPKIRITEELINQSSTMEIYDYLEKKIKKK